MEEFSQKINKKRVLKVGKRQAEQIDFLRHGENPFSMREGFKCPLKNGLMQCGEEKKEGEGKS